LTKGGYQVEPAQQDKHLVIRAAKPSDAARLVEHLYRHLAESGKGGSPVFGFPPALSAAEAIERLDEGYGRPLTDLGWERAFLLVEPDEPGSSGHAGEGAGNIVGHCELRTDGLPVRRHRATLGMGLERAFTGRGLGGRLLDATLTFAERATSLRWIDLGVFVGNEPARRLYQRVGFVETGRVRDMFRLADGTSIDDIQMSLRLPREPFGEVTLLFSGGAPQGKFRNGFESPATPSTPPAGPPWPGRSRTDSPTLATAPARVSTPMDGPPTPPRPFVPSPPSPPGRPASSAGRTAPEGQGFCSAKVQVSVEQLAAQHVGGVPAPAAPFAPMAGLPDAEPAPPPAGRTTLARTFSVTEPDAKMPTEAPPARPPGPPLPPSPPQPQVPPGTSFGPTTVLHGLGGMQPISQSW
jgi:RimJ/RimL family protein N-acetyltransferase